MGSLSMTCYGVGTNLEVKDAEGAATLPLGLPPDQSNM
jgi:hypothetical protein